MTVEEIEAAILNLDARTRASLARKLLLTLEDLSVEENMALWIEESERRLQELRTDISRSVDADEAFAEARRALKNT
jgi:ABC-type uncharacterized transport system ATPase component